VSGCPLASESAENTHDRPTMSYDDAALTPRQREIADNLKAHDAELARWFVSAAVLAREQRPAGWPELVAHLGRDLMNRAPEYFDLPRPARAEYVSLLISLIDALPAGFAQDTVIELQGKALKRLRKLIDAHRAAAGRPGPSALFAAAGRTGSASEVQRRALDGSWTSTQRGLVAAAHMRARGASPVDPGAVLELFARMEDLLASQLGGLRFWSLGEELAQLAGTAEPTRADLDRALVLARGQALNDFFESLHSPGWLAPMRAAGLLEEPTAAQVLENGGYRLPFWAPSRYLTRIAAADPDGVSAVILGLPETNNGRIHGDLIEAALAMPAEHAVRVAALVPSYLTRPFPLQAAERASALVTKLMIEHQPRAALELTREVFAVDTSILADRSLGVAVGFRHHFDSDYSYAEALESVAAVLADLAPLHGLLTLGDLLADVLARERELAGRPGPEDDSYVWRKAIEDHQQNFHDGEPRDALIVALRDIATHAMAVSPDSGPEILAALSRHEELIFRRIRLHLLRGAKFAGARERRREVFLDREAFDDPLIHRELYLLQRERFGELSEGERERVFAWIAGGPQDVERFAEGFERFEGRPASAQELAQRADGWRQRHLQPLERWLGDAERQQLDALTAAHGSSEHPEFRTWVTAEFRPVDLPYDSQRLRAMSTEQLLGLFDSWQPSGEGLSARDDGLGLAIAEAVREHPADWAARAPGFATAPSRYRYQLLTGFASAAAMDREFALAPVLELAGAHLAGGSPEQLDDLDARNGRRAIADLLRWTFRRHEHLPGVELREPIWQLLETLTRDPDTDAAPDSEAADVWSAAEGELPMPTVRSLSYEAVVGYARWVIAPSGERVSADLSAVQEVRRLLEAALDPVYEPSPAVRATLARALPTLFWIDPEWVERQLTRLFADEPELLTDAAWSGFLANEPVSLPLLRCALAAGIYTTGIEQIAGGERFSEAGRERLGRQLLSAAVFELDGYEEPWLAWLAREEAERRAPVVEWFGGFLSEQSDERPATFAAAVATCWEERLAALPDGDAELAAFGAWFAAELIEAPRAAELLLSTLQKSAGEIDRLSQVLVAAVRVAPSAPAAIVSALRLIARGPTAGRLAWYDRQVQSVLASVQASGDEDVITDAERLIGELAERGLGDFRLLSPTEGTER
jgi:hypothetical protein